QQTPRRRAITAAACTTALITALALWSCGGGGTQGQMGRGATTYPISGKVAGLARGKVTLQNGVDTVDAVPKDASGNDIGFTIAALPSNAKYDIQIAAKPDGTDCRVINGAGTVQDQAIANIIVQCFDVKSLLLIAGAPYTQPSQNSTKEEASFSRVGPAAVDSQGNIFVIDRNAIRRISTTNIVTTLAGLPETAGNAIGNGRQARFFNPNGIAVDELDRIIVADTDNHAIKQITQSGDVSVIAAASDASVRSDAAAVVALKNPNGLVYDKSRHVIYLADTGHHVIRMLHIGSDGKFLANVVAGVIDESGPETDQIIHFDTPTALAIDADGAVVIADSGNNTIRRLASDGRVTNLAGSSVDGDNPVPVDGVATLARLSKPTGVSVGLNGVIYVAERDCRRLRRISAQQQVSTVISSPGCDPSNQTSTREFDSPVALATLPDHSVLVADLGSDKQPGAILLRLVPGEIASDHSDTIMDFAGVGSEFGFRDGRGTRARFNFPQGMAMDSQGILHVVDTVNQTVRNIDAAGQVTTLALSNETSGTSLGNASGIALDANSNIYISDTNNRVIRKIDPAGRMSLLAGDPAANAAIVDGPLDAARFRLPGHMQMGLDNNLYLLDTTASAGTAGRIRRIDLHNNTVVTLTINGIPNVRSFSINRSGTIYAFTADLLRRAVMFRLVPVAGQVDTYAAEALQNTPNFLVASFTFENDYTAYAYTDRGIYSINLQGDNSITWSGLVSGNGSKTSTGPLPANVALPTAARNSFTIYTSGMVVHEGRLIFTDNSSIYAMTL
ncbi:MAG: hypothetical protein AB9M53_05760, partial [Leptothrix sp. (in: b-proteobacteria)]